MLFCPAVILEYGPTLICGFNKASCNCSHLFCPSLSSSFPHPPFSPSLPCSGQVVAFDYSKQEPRMVSYLEHSSLSQLPGLSIKRFFLLPSDGSQHSASTLEQSCLRRGWCRTAAFPLDYKIQENMKRDCPAGSWDSAPACPSFP